MTYHQNLEDVIEDQLSLAGIHHLRGHWNEAIQVYQRVLNENKSSSIAAFENKNKKKPRH